MATTYQDYYAKALKNYQPQMNAAMQESNANMADRGLYNSTGAVGQLASIRNSYDAQARQAAEAARVNDINLQNQQKQTALQWWDAIQNYNLARKQLTPHWKTKYADVPSWFKSYQSGDWLKNAPIGDGKGGEYKSTDNGGGATMGQMSLAENQRQANASIALRRAELAQAIREYNDKKNAAAADPWANLAAGLDDYVSRVDEKTGNRTMLPSSFVNLARTTGIDLIGAASDASDPHHEQAVAALKELYPGGTWKKFADQPRSAWDEYVASWGKNAPAAAAVPPAEDVSSIPQSRLSYFSTNARLQSAGQSDPNAHPNFWADSGATGLGNALGSAWSWLTRPDYATDRTRNSMK